MGSIIILSVALVFCFVFNVLFISLAARAVGSKRAQFRWSVLALVLCLLLNLIEFPLQLVLPHETSQRSLESLGFLLTIQWIAYFLIFKITFGLPVGRTFAPLAANLVCYVLGFAAAYFVISPFATQTFVVSTKSMSPTLEPGDRFMANKLVSPKRFDLIAYHPKAEPGSVYIQRIIGLPNERVRFESGKLYINDQSIAPPTVLTGRLHMPPLMMSPRYRDGQIIQLRDDEMFLVGDNIDISYDSRLMGPSKMSSLVGVADWMFWPIAKVKLMR